MINFNEISRSPNFEKTGEVKINDKLSIKREYLRSIIADPPSGFADDRFISIEIEGRKIPLDELETIVRELDIQKRFKYKLSVIWD